MSPTVHTYLTEDLVRILLDNGINPDEYGPAYNGESIGLDLFNVGPSLCVEPLQDSLTIELLGFEADEVVNLTWLDTPIDYRKAFFKTLMPTGLHVAIPRGYVGLIEERGSVTKTPVKKRAGVIDPGYTGEVFVNMINTCQFPYQIEAGAKSPFQLVVVKATNAFERVDKQTFDRIHADATRTQGMIGSSD